MKIVILSHDGWGFGKYIHIELENLNHKSTYINCMEFKYEYANILKHISAFCSKIFFKKNIKKEYRTNKTIEVLEKLPLQDYILVINAGEFNPVVFDLIKSKTKKLITYNYDSLKRVPLPPDAINIFDKIYSFDSEDIKNYPYLIKTNNYIYKEKQSVRENFSTKAFITLSKDKIRNKTISKIADQFDKKGYSGKYEFNIVDKKNRALNKNLFFLNKNIPYEQVLSKIENTEIMIDIVRKKQSGLSFRVFESLAYQKKLIITNPSIKNYPFYNPNNILVIDEDDPQIPTSFLDTKYQPINESIYNQFTINTWVKTIFELDLDK
jgi:hypothetical protein